MDNSYQWITAVATDAIEAMVKHPRDTIICNADAVRAIAVGVYFSWARHVGKAARPEDIGRMESMISGMAEPSR
ncbi:hypothetical protein CR105_27030 [Massilia eurypsychrophila]|uniref:Uncharacterized protein n=1 Tax=Massilia eurypsychrophila TaxID=1485217 RepID=A0A2G8T7F2_9BURK|nr:hypothetical protein CR105_27030 [Massilia eurypsychrophila]